MRVGKKRHTHTPMCGLIFIPEKMTSVIPGQKGGGDPRRPRSTSCFYALSLTPRRTPPTIVWEKTTTLITRGRRKKKVAARNSRQNIWTIYQCTIFTRWPTKQLKVDLASKQNPQQKRLFIT
eukprot:GEMP01117276.1.p1 GENE.GEMP01117276.1~~GEMP01117276.1.p1  ORF type:complete len:122 (-),score=6.36 GEMP01117276.1:166-531(-)